MVFLLFYNTIKHIEMGKIDLGGFKCCCTVKLSCKCINKQAWNVIFAHISNHVCFLLFVSCSSADEKFRWNNQGNISSQIRHIVWSSIVCNTALLTLNIAD